ncbi:hypothetical protein T484DRAFT_3639208, partial [Baffinella frigidus]
MEEETQQAGFESAVASDSEPERVPPADVGVHGFNGVGTPKHLVGEVADVGKNSNWGRAPTRRAATALQAPSAEAASLMEREQEQTGSESAASSASKPIAPAGYFDLFERLEWLDVFKEGMALHMEERTRGSDEDAGAANSAGDDGVHAVAAATREITLTDWRKLCPGLAGAVLCAALLLAARAWRQTRGPWTWKRKGPAGGAAWLGAAVLAMVVWAARRFVGNQRRPPVLCDRGHVLHPEAPGRRGARVEDSSTCPSRDWVDYLATSSRFRLLLRSLRAKELSVEKGFSSVDDSLTSSSRDVCARCLDSWGGGEWWRCPLESDCDDTCGYFLCGDCHKKRQAGAGGWRDVRVTEWTPRASSERIVQVREDAIDLRGSRMTEFPVGVRELGKKVVSVRLGACPLDETQPCWGSFPEWLGELRSMVAISLEGIERIPEMENAAEKLPSLVTLKLSRNMASFELPRWVWLLITLRNLQVSGYTRVVELPEEVGSLTGLETLGLSGCEGLQTLPKGLRLLTGLQELNLEGCVMLQELPDEIGSLVVLRTLNLKGCKRLQQLPGGVSSLVGLQTLDLKGCSRFKGPPLGVGSLAGLQTLRMGSRVEGLPEDVSLLAGLQKLILGDPVVVELSEEIGSLVGLQTLDLSGCLGLRNIPRSLWSLKGLQTLRMAGTGVEELPEEIGSLAGLQTLNLSCCFNLREIPRSLGLLTGLLTLRMAGTSVKELPEEIVSLAGLHTLDLAGCKSLKELPVCFSSMVLLQTLDLSHCESLKELPEEMGSLTELRTVNLSGCKSLQKLPGGFSSLVGLHTLDLSGCEHLWGLPEGMGSLTGLRKLNLSGCKSLQKLPGGFSSLVGLPMLDLSGCEHLWGLPEGMGSLTGLRTLNLSGCKSLQKLPGGFLSLVGLQTLDLTGCKSLEELPKGVGLLTGLRELNLSGCTNLTSLPGGIGMLTGLRKLDLDRCSKL